MNVDVRPIRTAAESALALNFAAAKSKLPGADEIAALRDAAFRRFEAEGLPSRRVEEWKYTDLRALMAEAKPLARLPDAAAKRRALEQSTLLVEARRIVLVDGSFVPELSDLERLEPGLAIRSMSAALAQAERGLVSELGNVAPNTDLAMAL
ncbi:MAG: Fe-S cluster assembly protein SufD, partial [Alphaproteobacteria bacterium]